VRVGVGIVTYQSAGTLGRCLAAVRAQTVRPDEVLVWDNGSADASRELARAGGATVVAAGRNLGFAAAANELVARTRAPYLLLLNPDAYLRPDYVEKLLAAAEADRAVGSLTGKLLRSRPEGGAAVIDSTGHVLCRNRAVLNRGENEVDTGQYDQPGEVFGVCAAAALYRRAMLEDVRVGAHYFDPAFFMYLEDVDLDWRARLRGWRAWYVPGAVADHERGHQGRRGARRPSFAHHSLKNRYLLILRNDRWADLLRDLPAVLGMEAVRFVDYALTHPRALRGYLQLVGSLRQALAARRAIQARRRVGSEAVRGWLAPYPFRARLARTGAARPDADPPVDAPPVSRRA
jgi:GT2 family glycosyltransferase